MSFLDLAAELRLKIYSYMAVPEVDAFSQYHGLYLSCHQTQAEMDKECGAILSAHLESIRTLLEEGASFTIPASFLEMQHISLEIDFATYQHPLNHTQSLLKLLRLRLSTITTTLESDNPRKGDDGMIWTLNRLWDGHVDARSFRLNMPVMDEETARRWVPLPPDFVLRGYRHRWVVEHGKPVRAEWQRSYEHQRGGEIVPDDVVLRAMQGLD
jgi:hypothetical protein